MGGYSSKNKDETYQIGHDLDRDDKPNEVKGKGSKPRKGGSATDRPKLKKDLCGLPLDLELHECQKWIPPVTCGRVLKVYDGDTITIATRIPGLKGSAIYQFSVRLSGIDAPEIRGKNEAEKLAAQKSKLALSEMVFGQDVELKNVGFEKYGRLLCGVYVGKTHVNKWMVDKGFAYAYDGGKKQDLF